MPASLALFEVFWKADFKKKKIITGVTELNCKSPVPDLECQKPDWEPRNWKLAFSIKLIPDDWHQFELRLLNSSGSQCRSFKPVKSILRLFQGYFEVVYLAVLAGFDHFPVESCYFRRFLPKRLVDCFKVFFDWLRARLCKNHWKPTNFRALGSFWAQGTASRAYFSAKSPTNF